MKRREFIESITAGLIAASAGVTTSAQAPTPKIMLFGFTVISKNGTGIVANMPKVGSHDTFLAGPSAVINQLAASLKEKAIPGAGSGIGVGHDDLDRDDITLMCLKVPRATIGKAGDAAGMDRLDVHVPKLPEIADKMQAGSHSFGAYPAGSVRLEFNGGTLKMPGQKSNNPGVNDVPWQFQLNGNDVGKPYKLTDLLVFHATANSIDVAFGGTAAVTLQAGQQLWFINVPTIKDTTDKDPMTIEHAHEWFSLLTPAVGGGIRAVAKKPVVWPVGSWVFKHPCQRSTPPKIEAAPGGKNLPKPKVAFFPPDTDPCFIVTE
jgi:hypothetical protein